VGELTTLPQGLLAGFWGAEEKEKMLGKMERGKKSGRERRKMEGGEGMRTKGRKGGKGKRKEREEKGKGREGRNFVQL